MAPTFLWSSGGVRAPGGPVRNSGLMLTAACLALLTAGARAEAPSAPAASALSPEASVVLSTDPMFAEPYIDIDEWRDAPVRHHYIHGGFKGTDTRFSFYFPSKEQFKGHFFQHITPVPDSENLAQRTTGADDKIGFSIASGAYFVETNGGGAGSAGAPGARVDPTIAAYRANAAAARYSRVVAAGLYGPGRIFLRLGIAVQRMIRVPEPEMVIEAIAEIVLHLGPIPVRLPGKGLAIPQGFHHDHLALEFARRDRAGGRLGEQRTQQHRTLRIDRLAVRSAELIPSIVVRARDLMAVIGLGGQEVAVVDLNLVARLQRSQHLGVTGHDQHDVVGDFAQLHAFAGGRARQDD